MSRSVYGDITEPGAGSDSRPNSLVTLTVEVDSRKSFDLTLNIRLDPKNEEELEATRKEAEKKKASAAEKEPSDRLETTDDFSSISNDRDRPEDAHGNGRDRTKDGTGKEKPESSMWHKQSAKKDESDKKETEYEHFEATPVATDFNDLPDEIVLLIFKWIGARDRLGLEGVNKRWKELLIQSWKGVRILNVSSDICAPSLTYDNVAFLRARVAPYVNTLDFTGLWQPAKWAMGRLIFSFLSFPPNAVKEVLFSEICSDNMMIVDSSTVFCLKRIGDQITSLALFKNNVWSNPEKILILRTRTEEPSLTASRI